MKTTFEKLLLFTKHWRGSMKHYSDAMVAYKNSAKYFRNQHELYQKKYYESCMNQPLVEFILGDRITGMIWTYGLDEYSNININEKILVDFPNEGKRQYVVKTFLEIRKNIISFQIENIT